MPFKQPVEFFCQTLVKLVKHWSKQAKHWLRQSSVHSEAFDQKPAYFSMQV
jgi:hypothetical protein